MMNARYRARIGALAIALSVGSGVAETTGMATAQADSALNKLRPNMSASAGSKDIIRSGSATATSNGRRSVAIAVGKGSVAAATGGVNNRAVVIGKNSHSIAGCTQTQNTNPSVGCSSAFTGNDNNVARATDNARALAGGRSDGPGSYVDGTNNTATATGDGSTAIASFGDQNTANVNGANSTAYAVSGDFLDADATDYSGTPINVSCSTEDHTADGCVELP